MKSLNHNLQSLNLLTIIHANLQPDTCFYCKAPLFKGRTRDHIISKEKLRANFSPGFRSLIGRVNTLPSCLDCNQLKGDLSLKDFQESVFKMGLFDIVKNIESLYNRPANGPEPLSLKIYGEEVYKHLPIFENWYLYKEGVMIRNISYDGANEQSYQVRGLKGYGIPTIYHHQPKTLYFISGEVKNTVTGKRFGPGTVETIEPEKPHGLEYLTDCHYIFYLH